MPTINAIANQAFMVASLSTRFFNGNLDAANDSVLVGSAFGTIGNMLQSQFGGQPALTNIVENYNERRDNFNEELRDNVDSVRDSADRLRETVDARRAAAEAANADNDNDSNTGSTLSTLNGFANGNIPPEQRNQAAAIAAQNNERAAAQRGAQVENNNRNTNEINQRTTANPLSAFAEEYLTAETEEEEDTAEIAAVGNDNNADNRLNSVINLVRDYNNTVNYLNENSKLSNRISALTNNLSGNLMLSEALIKMGISVNDAGTLSVNESLLSLALSRDTGEADVLLGGNGLAGRLDRNMDLMNAQGDRLFPNIADFANQRNQDEAESLYTMRNLNTAAYAWQNTGRLLTMFT